MGGGAEVELVRFKMEVGRSGGNLKRELCGEGQVRLDEELGT